MILKYRYLISFILALILYILFIFSLAHLYQKKDFQKFSQKKTHSFKMNLKTFVLPKNKIVSKKVIKKAFLQNKRKILPKKQLIKKEKRLAAKKIEFKKSKIIKPRELNKTKIVKSKFIKKKKIIKVAEKQRKTKLKKTAMKNIPKKHKKNSLVSFLSKPQMPSLQKISKTMNDQEIEKLYKGKFDSFTKGQKEFIKKNLSLIGKITQKYLTQRGYPYFAAQTRQEGMNIIQFYLYPNGDIKNLKIIKSSGYETLDQNSIDTILEAYKDYPRPKEKTLIRIYVRYNIIY